MVKSELIKAIRSKIKASPELVEDVVNTTISEIALALKNEGEVTLRGLGSFKTIQKEERQGRNPKTGEPAIISARKVVSFKAGALLTDTINN